MANMKSVRFITPHYQTKFTVSEGGKVRITKADGTVSIEIVHILDEYHFRFESGNMHGCYRPWGDGCFHICQFAEQAESMGWIVEAV